ncbi:integrase catalytic domain-containing protein [Trichonephila clavipes]|nr:integrase catalytic domain-containing protein [Trichonephila clavipes]
MALKLNLKKDELISVAVEMGLEIPSKAKIIDLKKLIESSSVYKNDIEFVRSLVENALQKKFEPTPQECLSNFKKARKLPSENYVQFASRLSATFDYYCQLRKVNEFRSLCDLIISDKIFETLDRYTMNHIATKQGETYFKPQQLGRECDVYLSARGKVSNDLMSRNPGSGVKTDGRNRLQTVSTWRQERNSSNVFVAETKPNCVLWQIEGSVEANSQSQFVATGFEKGRLKNVFLSATDIDQAETKLIRMVQEQVFLAEIKSLQSKGVVSPNSKLRNLNPFIDSDGLLRVGGRLSNSDLNYVNKHPVILPGNHNLTVQIIVHFHRKNLHTGASSLLHYLMGNLPRDRVVLDYPFNCSAIHIEIVSDLTSDAFIATLRRFFSRRGKCAKLYSDNGKTFVGANKELKRFLKLIEDSDDNLAGFLSAEGIEWKFIPPRAPSFGGLWEASVKSIKYHLRRVVSGSNLTYEEFLIVCIQIEGILNSRPLYPLSSNSDDLNALTPAHFLIGRSMTSVVEPNLIELKENALKKWQRITRLVQLIWNKWHRCYLSELQQRNKWQFKKQNVNVGGLVVLIEDNMPTFKWPSGRITEIYSGSDALIMVVKVKTQFGEYKRAISRVCLLPMPV